MEFKITIFRNPVFSDDLSGDKPIFYNYKNGQDRESVRSKLEAAIMGSSFQWKDDFTISDLDGYHRAYLDGLDKGEQIFNKAIERNR